jgi:hypothetical protein
MMGDGIGRPRPAAKAGECHGQAKTPDANRTCQRYASGRSWVKLRAIVQSRRGTPYDPTRRSHRGGDTPGGPPGRAGRCGGSSTSIRGSIRLPPDGSRISVGALSGTPFGYPQHVENLVDVEETEAGPAAE